MATTERFLPDDAATAAFGAELAARLAPGDLVLLEGGLGAGKTALARSTIRMLLADPALEVPSPSFALVQPYESNGRFVLHADLYRLAAARDVDELGLFDRPDAIVIVEWPDRAPDLDGRARYRVALAVPPDGQGRLATIEERP